MLPRWLSGKELVCNTGDLGSIPGSGRSSGGANDNPLQYSCLENPMDRGTWWATVCRVAKSRTWLNDWACLHTVIHICCVGIMVSVGLYLSKNQLSGEIYAVFQLLCCWNPVSFFFYENFHGVFQVLAGNKSENIIYLYSVKTPKKWVYLSFV